MAADDDLVDRAVLAGGLAARYQQAHRHYHNLEHIEFVLDAVDQLAPGKGVVAVRLAAWFHDAVYAPGRDDNEERSAFVAEEALEIAGASPALINEVARLVRLTKDHDPKPDDIPGSVLSDADLSILASDPDSYQRYAAKVRREYDLIPDGVFFPARKAILERFLKRSYLFATPVGREQWEQSARHNVSLEIEKLTEMK